jgi:tetratricopeptide (TPR) repeat protein
MTVRTLWTAFLCLLLTIGVAWGMLKGEDKVGAFTTSIKKETAGDLKGAIESLLNLPDGGNTDYLTTLRLGWLYYNSRDFEKSAKYYKEAIRLSDNSIEALLGVTLPYAAQGKWDLVQDTYKTILGSDKLNYTANLRLGQIYLNLGNYLMAKKHFDLLFESYPGDYETNLFLGWTYYGLGSKGKAREAFVNAMSVYPADTSAVKGYGLTK